MGTPSPSRQGAGGPAIVAFDFDGTLTVRDSFSAFLMWDAGAARTALAAARLAPAGLRYLVDRDRGRLKAATVRVLLGGRSLVSLEVAAQAFADEVVLLRPDALRRWEAWGERGARRVIVTASPEYLVAPFARRLGATRLIATRLGVDGRGRLTGALIGRNCRGPEKVARLRAAFGPDVRLAAAYGDSAGDREMLSLADEAGMRVFRERP